jgi:hypothetical protein
VFCVLEYDDHFKIPPKFDEPHFYIGLLRLLKHEKQLLSSVRPEAMSSVHIASFQITIIITSKTAADGRPL